MLLCCRLITNMTENFEGKPRNANGGFNLFFKMENIIDVITQVTAFVSVIYINKQNILYFTKKIDFSFQLHNNANIKEFGR